MTQHLAFISPNEFALLERKLAELKLERIRLEKELQSMAIQTDLRYEDFIDVHLKYVEVVKDEAEAKARHEAILAAKAEQEKKKLERRRAEARAECSHLTKPQILDRMGISFGHGTPRSELRNG